MVADRNTRHSRYNLVIVQFAKKEPVSYGFPTLSENSLKAFLGQVGPDRDHSWDKSGRDRDFPGRLVDVIIWLFKKRVPAVRARLRCYRYFSLAHRAESKRLIIDRVRRHYSFPGKMV